MSRLTLAGMALCETPLNLFLRRRDGGNEYLKITSVSEKPLESVKRIFRKR